MFRIGQFVRIKEWDDPCWEGLDGFVDSWLTQSDEDYLPGKIFPVKDIQFDPNTYHLEGSKLAFSENWLEPVDGEIDLGGEQMSELHPGDEVFIKPRELLFEKSDLEKRVSLASSMIDLAGSCYVVEDVVIDDVYKLIDNKFHWCRSWLETSTEREERLKLEEEKEKLLYDEFLSLLEGR